MWITGCYLVRLPWLLQSHFIAFTKLETTTLARHMASYIYSSLSHVSYIVAIFDSRIYWTTPDHPGNIHSWLHISAPLLSFALNTSFSIAASWNRTYPLYLLVLSVLTVLSSLYHVGLLTPTPNFALWNTLHLLLWNSLTLFSYLLLVIEMKWKWRSFMCLLLLWDSKLSEGKEMS